MGPFLRSNAILLDAGVARSRPASTSFIALPCLLPLLPLLLLLLLYSTRRHMLEPVRPEAVFPDRALCLPTFSHFLIVNKTSLSVSVSPPISPSW